MYNKKSSTNIYRFAAFLLSVLLVCSLAGCQPSKKKVMKSKYYKALQKENKKLKKEVKELESKVEKENNISEDSKRASDYLERIARDRIIKMEVGYADNMEGGEFITDNEAAFSMATAIAVRADECSKYSVEEVEKKYGPGYEYILYDEDNACYEVMVYDGNYVIFLDLPDRVYYAYDACALGEAFLHYKNGYPNSKLLHRLADSPLITDADGNYYDRNTAYKVANSIDRMQKNKTNREKAEKDLGNNKKGASYVFYHHGNKMKLTLYEKYIRIQNMDEKVVWYKASGDDIAKLSDLFKEGRNPGKSESVKKEDAADSTSQTHLDEMETDESTATEKETNTTEYYDEEGNEG